MHRSLWVTSVMLMFFALFDGINGYAVPLLLLQNGISKSATGLIMSASSAAGAAFDLILMRFIKRTNYRRIYLRGPCRKLWCDGEFPGIRLFTSSTFGGTCNWRSRKFQYWAFIIYFPWIINRFLFHCSFDYQAVS